MEEDGIMTLCLYLLAALLLSHAITDTALPAGPPSRPLLETALPAGPPSRPLLETALPAGPPSRPLLETALPARPPSRPLLETALPARPPSRPQSRLQSPSVVALNPPHIHNLENGKTMDLDITSFYASKRCPFDSQLAFIFSDDGSKFSKKTLKDPTGSTHHVYNAIIDLFSIIEYLGWTDSLCKDEILKSVSAHSFCSDLSFEKLLEKESERFLVALEKTYPGVFDVHVVRDLQGIKDEKECAMKCGGMQASALCRTFTLLNVFLEEKLMELQTRPTSVQRKSLYMYIVYVIM